MAEREKYVGKMIPPELRDIMTRIRRSNEDARDPSVEEKTPPPTTEEINLLLADSLKAPRFRNRHEAHID